MDNMIDSYDNEMAKEANKYWAKTYLPDQAKEEQWSLMSPAASAWAALAAIGESPTKYGNKRYTAGEMRDLLLERELQRRKTNKGPSSAWKHLMQTGEFPGPLTIEDQLP